ncbi:hypothetical protein GCM10022419_048940 [Nonomuraea rosea]|uniref:Protein kinase domain-containing protein n=1 Tax=Nonomuraea rosea TaxID=638574 RepID=A0ABP6X944_9ACTN
MAYRILHEEPDLGDLPEPLRGIVTRCLAKDPARRPSARTVLLELLGDPDPPPTPGTAPTPDPAPASGTGRGVAAGRESDAPREPATGFGRRLELDRLNRPKSFELAWWVAIEGIELSPAFTTTFANWRDEQISPPA